MLASEQLVLPMRIATMVAPVAVYFLILGLLNSRRHPQMLSGRLDFALLVGAMSPLFMLPAVEYFGASPYAAAAAVIVLAGAVTLLAGPSGTWVIYNISEDDARRAVAGALARAGLSAQEGQGGFGLSGAFLEVGSFPLLRNVSIRLNGGDRQLQRRLGRALGEELASLEAVVSPMAVSLLLVAIAMIVAPLTLVAHRVPEIARVLMDLLH